MRVFESYSNPGGSDSAPFETVRCPWQNALEQHRIPSDGVRVDSSLFRDARMSFDILRLFSKPYTERVLLTVISACAAWWCECRQALPKGTRPQGRRRVFSKGEREVLPTAMSAGFVEAMSLAGSDSLQTLNRFHDLLHDRCRIGLQNPHVVDELADIQLPLSQLDFRHERPRASQFLGDLLLSPTPLFTQTLEGFQKDFPLGSVERFCEAFIQLIGFTLKFKLSDFRDN
jgi:hypothetical protein